MMKKRMGFMFAVVALMLALLGTASAAEISIDSESDLRGISSTSGNTYTLTTSITVTDPWTDGIDLTSATFDGGGYTVTLPDNASTGLFDDVTSSTVKNVTVAGSITTSSDNVGGIANRVNGESTFINCTNNATVDGGERAGGIVGYVDIDSGNMTIEGCTNTGAISATNAGGIIGDLDLGTNYKLTIKSYVDESENTTITSNSGDIEGDHAGGLVGHIDGDTVVSDAKNTGEITGAHTGGLVACCDGTISITNSSNSGAVNGTLSNPETNYCAGGLVGYAQEVLAITGCTNTGDVTSNSSGGGILGESKAGVTVTGTTVDCTVTATTAGAVVGSISIDGGVTTISGCTLTVADSDGKYITDAVGENKSTNTPTEENNTVEDGTSDDPIFPTTSNNEDGTVTITVFAFEKDTEYTLPTDYT